MTVRGFYAYYNECVTFINLELEVQGLYSTEQNKGQNASKLNWGLAYSMLQYVQWKQQLY